MDDGVGTGDNPACIVEAWLIKWMGQGLDHPAGGRVRQLGVTVQGDDETDVRQVIRIPHRDQGWSILGPCPIDKAVQFLQLAPFTFPADEFLFGIAPAALAVEEEKTLAPVALVEGFNLLSCIFQQEAVILQGKVHRHRYNQRTD